MALGALFVCAVDCDTSVRVVDVCKREGYVETWHWERTGDEHKNPLAWLVGVLLLAGSVAAFALLAVMAR